MVSSIIMPANPYASFVGTREPREVVEATPLELHRLAGRIGAARITMPRAPVKWSARDILAHLADCEIAFGYRLRQVLAEDQHVLQPFDQDKWSAPYSKMDANLALSLFESLRNWNVALLKTVTAQQMQRKVTHPERGEMTFATIVETMAGHDLNHLKQLEEIAGRSA